MVKRLLAQLGLPEAAPPWTLIGAGGAMVAAFAAIIIGTVIAQIVVPAVQFGILLGWSLGAVLMIVFVFISRRKPNEQQAVWSVRQEAPIANPGGKRARASLPTTVTPVERPAPNLFFLLFIGVGLALSLDVVGRVITGNRLPEAELQGLYQSFLMQGSITIPSWLIALVFMALLQPLGEGLIFQGLLLPSLRTTFGPWPGLLLAGLLYGVFHYIAYPPGFLGVSSWWHGLISPVLAGLIYAAVRIVTGSTRAAILTHAAFGVFGVLNLLTLVG
jgi:membrane protease YdiL (CAAX protease family)